MPGDFLCDVYKRSMKRIEAKHVLSYHTDILLIVATLLC